MSPSGHSLSSVAGALVASLVLPLVTATAPPPAAVAACKAIRSRGIETQITPQDFLNSDYVDGKNHYWSGANADLSPSCPTFPSNTGEISKFVTILQNGTGVNFVVKSGGHNPNMGYSSIAGAVLISMSKLASTVLSLNRRQQMLARERDGLKSCHPWRRIMLPSWCVMLLNQCLEFR
jgi:hypothetical protein